MAKQGAQSNASNQSPRVHLTPSKPATSIRDDGSRVTTTNTKPPQPK